MENTVHIYLVDDHSLLRGTMRMYLEQEDGFEIVGETDNAKAAMDEIVSIEPDVVLMDLSLPDQGGITLTKNILEKCPDMKIIAVTMHPESMFLLSFLEAGGVGYIHKSAAVRELISGIKTVLDGGIYLSEAGVQLVAGNYRGGKEKKDKETRHPMELLSSREKEVLRLLARGYSCKEAGSALYLATTTVETYKRRIYEKLELQSRVDLINFALENKLFEDL